MAFTQLYYPPTSNGLQKTLDAQLDEGATASMTLNNVTGIQDKAGVVLINRVDSSGTEKTAALREYVVYTGVSGSTLTGLTRGIGGTTDQDHAVGSVVEFISDITWAQAIIDFLLINHVEASGLHDFNGTEVILDADADSSLTADTDDQLDIKLANADKFRFKSVDFDMVTATANIQVAGADPKRGLYVPASAMYGATTSGAATGQIETSTNKVNVKVLDFDTSADEYACFNIPAPSYWDLSTITAQFHWTSAGGSPSETVTWAIQALARSDDDALDTAYGTAVTVEDTLIATNDEHISAATSAITVGGTPAKGDMLYFRIYRDVSADNVSDDARLLGVRISFGISQYNDA